MGVNDDREMLDAARLEVTRLERALIAIRGETQAHRGDDAATVDGVVAVLNREGF